MNQGRIQLQIDTSKAVRNRAKAVAYGQGISLTELVLKALADVGDKELRVLIEKDLEKRGGRGASKKIIVFGLLKHDGKVYTQIVPNVSRKTLKQIVQMKVEPDSTIYSDGWRSYDSLVDWGYKHHYRVSHGNNEFVSKDNPKNHINGIENFWGITKVRLAKLRGLRKDHFNLHLKECEFRYNMRHEEIKTH
ncbi:IS1595 family transposase [Candidatus Saccharibacteria bacterium oral taxon 955]|nr:IS1595 family transposase [Candidatus Saccharibacteria bacterium oral taxon 955]QHU89709.1 IS1595 family transposase [Candidatus Saccharibacteria bacterium oral taxon 955]